MRFDACKGLVWLDVMCIDLANDMSQRLRITLVDQEQFLGVTQLLEDRLGAVLEPLNMDSLVHLVHVYDLSKPDQHLDENLRERTMMLYQK
jgi:hypothetical protein